MVNMLNGIFNLFVKSTFKLRILFDKFLFLFLSQRNNWNLLDEFKNRDILIVGNGPSLNQTPLSDIKLVSIGMNKINLIFDKTEWRPDIIVAINGLVIKQNKTFFNTTNIPIIVPASAIYLGIKPRKNIFYVNRATKSIFSSDIRRFISKTATVTYTCMEVAGFLNSRSISIVGVDHNFIFSGSNKIDKLVGSDMNHFDPNYFKDSLWGLPDLKGSEDDYKRALHYFTLNNVNITDYTINGKCEIFKKGKIDDLLEG